MSRTPAEQAEAFARKKREYYMVRYREKHRDRIRAKQKDYYKRVKQAKNKEDNDGERQRREVACQGKGDVPLPGVRGDMAAGVSPFENPMPGVQQTEEPGGIQKKSAADEGRPGDQTGCTEGDS
jgi:hypothetical protein